MGMTELLVKKILEYKTMPIPRDVEKAACRHMLDTFACIVTGMQEKTPQALLHYFDARQCDGGVRLLGNSHIRVNTEDAALYYGACAHVCDFDNLSKNFGGHPGAITLPVVLALGSELGAEGKQLLRSFVGGTEIAAILGKATASADLHPEWNPTTLLGIFASVAAGAILLDFDYTKTLNAIGIAAGDTSGLKINYASAAKDLTVGHTASKAIFALKMAERNLTGAREPLGAKSGLFSILMKNFDEAFFESVLENHKSDFLFPGIIMKPYPACRGVHNGIDDMLQILKDTTILPDQIETILCKVQDTVFSSNRYPIPKNGVEGKFSLPYCLALCVLNKKVTPDDFTESTVITDEMLSIMNLVKLVYDPDFTDAKSGIEVSVRLKDKTSYSTRSCFAKGDPRNPMTDKEFYEKLHHCFERRLSSEQEQALILLWQNVQTINLEKMYPLLEK